jgi:hypothetical protein
VALSLHRHLYHLHLHHHNHNHLHLRSIPANITIAAIFSIADIPSIPAIS